MSYKTFSRVIFWLLAAIVIFVPLVHWSGVFFSYTFTKTVVFRLLVEVALILWLPLAYVRSEFRPHRSSILFAFSAWIGVLILSSILGVDFEKSLWSDYERMMGLWTQLHFFAFFIILTSILRIRENWLRIFMISLGTAGLVSLIGIFESFSSENRIISTVGNSAFLASYLLTHVFLALMFLFEEKQFSLKAGLYILLGFIVSFALVLTEARAGMLGLGIGLIVFVGLFLWKASPAVYVVGISANMAKRILMILVGITAMFIVATMIFQDTVSSVAPDFLDRYVSVSFSDRTTFGRLVAWDVAWNGWKERLSTGWGPENFNILFDKNYTPELYEQEPWFDRAHNFIFDMGATSGIAGLIAYMSVFVTAGFVLVRAYRNNAQNIIPLGICAAGAGYFVQNIFTFDTVVSFVPICLFVGYAAFLTKSQETKQNIAPVRNMSFPLSLGAAAVGVCMIPYAYWVNAAPWLENVSARGGANMLARGESDAAAIQQFEKALSYNRHGNIDTRRFFAEYIFEFLKQGGSRPDESLRMLMNQAIIYMDANIAEDPLNVKWVMYQGQLYNLMAVRFNPEFAHNAEAKYLRARELSPGRPQIYLELAQAYKVQGRFEDMWQEIDAVLEILPNYRHGYINAVVHAIDIKDIEREQMYISWIFERNTGIPEIRDAYFRVERYALAADTQKHFIESENNREDISNQERAILYAHLAALYQYADNLKEARATAMKVLELDPARRNEVRAFLNSL